MKLRRIILLCCFCCMSLVAYAQFTVGTTGLMHLPTADMQQDKTFMAGWSWLDTHATPNYKGYGWAQEPTMNYYINITMFPWLEISYDCTLIRGKYLAAGRGLPVSIFKKWANQDRNFSFRLRAWKEGWWKWWTPQIVFGANDALHTFSGSSGQVGISDSGNGFWGRLYVAATKHFTLNNVGNVGVHAVFFHNDRQDFRYRGLGIGTDFTFDGLKTGYELADKLIHPLNLMAEYDSRTVNVGARYSIWKDYINLVGEWNEAKYFSGGVYFKLHLR